MSHANGAESCRGKCERCPLAGPGGTFAFLLRPEYGQVIENHSRLRSHPKGATIVSQGQPVNGWHVLRSGAARIFLLDEEGREHTVRFAQPGDLIGGCAGDALGDPHGNCYSAVALADGTEVCHFPAGSLARVFEECPPLAEAFLGLMVRHLADSYHRLQALSTTTVRERLVDALLRLAEAQQGPRTGPAQKLGPRPVTFRLARQQLADILGVTKETAVRALTSLKRGGLVQTKGQWVTITDVEALKAREAGLR